MLSQKLGSLYVEIGARIEKFQAAMTKAERAVNRVGRQFTAAGQKMTLGISAPLGLIVKQAVGASIAFESAFAGVRKTVDATEAEFKGLEKGIRDMAKRIPASAAQIAQVAEAAGQLGIKTENILEFSRVMVDLGVATNLSANDAATALARLANITQMPQDQFDRLGSTLVALGNTLATTEAEIVQMGLRLAGAGKQIGLTEDQILSFAGALSSVGIEAQAGGTAFSKVFKQLALAVDQGGRDLELFAATAGMSASQFAEAFRKDAAGAIVSFIEGLGRFKQEGGSVIALLRAMGMEEIRLSDALLRASGAGDLFRRSLETGSQAWRENNALAEEARRRYETTESQLKILGNQLTEVSLVLGEAVLPAIVSFTKSVTPAIESVAEAFREMSESTRLYIVAAVALVAALGPVLYIIGSLATGLGVVIKIAKNSITALIMLKGAFVSLAAALGIGLAPLAAVLAALASLGYLAYTIYDNWEPLKALFSDLWDSLQAAALGALVTIQQKVQEWLNWFDQQWALFRVGLDTVAVAFEYMKDRSLAAVQALVEGAKTWLVDKFNSILGSVKEGADKVIGFFENIYREVVGNSSIPDTIEGIRKEIGRLDTVMVKPTEKATAQTSKYFALLEQATKESAKKTADGVDKEAKRIEKALGEVDEILGDLAANVDKTTDKLRADLAQLVSTKDFEGIKALAREYGTTVNAVGKFKETLRDAIRDVDEAERGQERLKERLSRTNQEIERLTGKTPQVSELASKIVEMMRAGDSQGIQRLAKSFGTSAEKVDEFDQALYDARMHLDELQRKGEEAGYAIADAFASVAESIGISSRSASVLANFMASFLTGTNTGGYGGAAGSALGGDGGLISSISSWFGGSKEVANPKGYYSPGGDPSGSGAGETRAAAGSGMDVAGYIQAGAAIYSGFSAAEEKDKEHGDNRGTGQAWGSAAGAIVGASFGMPGVGAAIGGALGEIIGSLFGRGPSHPETIARHEFANWLEDQFKALGEVSFFDKDGILRSYKNFNFIEGGTDRFNTQNLLPGELSWSEQYLAMGNEAVEVFNGLGYSLKEMLGLTDAVGDQLGYLLADNLVGNIDNARLLVRQLGLDQEDMMQSLFAQASRGEINWLQYNSAVRGVNEAFKEGLVGVGAYSQALQQLVDSGGAGYDALLAVKNIGIEALEAEVKDLAELKEKLIAEGNDPEVVEALFQAAANRGIETLEQWRAMSDETAGAIVGDMYALNSALADRWQQMQNDLDAITEKMKNIPEKVKSTVDVKVNISDADRAVIDQLGSGSAPTASPAGSTERAAKGRVVHTPSTMAMANGGTLKYAELAPEAIMPLARTKGGKLGVNVAGMDEIGKGLNLYMDLRGAGPGVEAEVRRAVEEMEDRLIRKATELTADRRNRGGAYGDQF